MAEFAINTNAILAVRAEADYCSEMVSQLLFGEYCTILEEKNGYYKIENHIDKFTGWVAQNGLLPIGKDEFESLINQPRIQVCVPMADVFCMTDKTIYRLPMASFIPNFNPDNGKFEIGDKQFQIHTSFVTFLPSPNAGGIIPTAIALLNTPYLNGGKTLMGMDCSGLAQTVFSTNGYALPRFSAHQSNTGETVASIEDANPGDLLFFTSQTVPSHTGIYKGNNQMIHAGASVIIQDLDDAGGYTDTSSGIYNKLYRIKRLS